MAFSKPPIGRLAFPDFNPDSSNADSGAESAVGCQPTATPWVSESIDCCPPRKGSVILRPFTANDETWARYPGRCPGLASSAPLVQQRGLTSKWKTRRQKDLGEGLKPKYGKTRHQCSLLIRYSREKIRCCDRRWRHHRRGGYDLT